ncbi:MAG TPA: AI-2E family transporter [Vicinamibacterales bacterium]|nr:AI-2E family transporter [Vicinamibacterales bacterium]
MARPSDPRPLILWTVGVVIAAGVLLWTAWLARRVLLLIYVSALLAIGFSPVVRLIERQRTLLTAKRRVPRWLAILVLYLLVLGAVAGVAMMTVPPLVAQARALWQELPRLFDRAQDYLISIGLLREHLTLREAVARAPAGSTDAVSAVLATLWGFAGGLFGVLTILILTFYLLVEAETLGAYLLRLVPADRRHRAYIVMRNVTARVSAWLTGQILLAAIIGTTAAVGLWLLGVPYFYVLALVAGLGEMIPIVGPILAAVPAVAVGFGVSVQKGLAVLAFYIVQQQVENHVLVPKVMQRQVGISAATVIIALLIGGELLGIVGAILAVPTAAIVHVLLQEFAAGPDDGAAGAPDLIRPHARR